MGDLPRFNMPYELGLDIGSIEYGSRKLKSKKILILESEKYHYLKVISDISGQDISSHDDDPKKLLSRVITWFESISPPIGGYGVTHVWTSYNKCLAEIANILSSNYTEDEIKNMTIAPFIKYVKDWVQGNTSK